MSNLLSQASLVMIPSGYKEDVVYSQIPTDGSGDLSFTRASNGTRVNSQGLVEVAPWNLYTYSEEFNNSIWANGNATITANTTTAPNGTTTADSIFEQVVNDYQIRGQNVSMVSGQVFTFSIYAKANTRNFFRILVGNGVLLSNQSAYFDLVNVTTTSTASITSSIESVGNGWCKIVISFTCNNTATDAIYYGPSPNMTSGYFPFVGDASKNVYIWGAQLNIGSTAKPYFPTTDRLNVPRLTYQNGGGGCPSLLLEKQSTNLVTYSEQFDNASWSNASSSVTANNTTSPDGTQNADLITFTSTTYASIYQAATTTNGTTYTASVYAKKGNQNFLGLEIRGASSSTDTVFNLNTGVIVSGTGTIESVGNGWYRCTITKAANSTSTLLIIGRGDSGANNDTVYLWGAQLEASSYATSYIPTTSSSATRVADECKKTGISSLIGQQEGVVFVDFMVTDPANFQSIQIYNNEKNASVISVISIQFNIDTVIAQIFRGNGTFDNILLAKNGYGLNQRLKVAFRYKSGDLALYINGVQADTDLGTYTANGTKAEVNLCDPSVYFAYKGCVNFYDFVQFPTALTNAELASLTTL